jgi:hypothetical protein
MSTQHPWVAAAKNAEEVFSCKNVALALMHGTTTRLKRTSGMLAWIDLLLLLIIA